eukprot:2153111-Pyramimonas_sp.AAC.2
MNDRQCSFSLSAACHAAEVRFSEVGSSNEGGEGDHPLRRTTSSDMSRRSSLKSRCPTRLAVLLLSGNTWKYTVKCSSYWAIHGNICCEPRDSSLKVRAARGVKVAQLSLAPPRAPAVCAEHVRATRAGGV